MTNDEKNKVAMALYDALSYIAACDPQGRKFIEAYATAHTEILAEVAGSAKPAEKRAIGFAAPAARGVN